MAVDPESRLKLKPQNLLLNLPLARLHNLIISIERQLAA